MDQDEEYKVKSEKDFKLNIVKRLDKAKQSKKKRIKKTERKIECNKVKPERTNLTPGVPCKENDSMKYSKNIVIDED
jgi:hypothetical protein